MNLKLEIEFSKADILKEIDALKKQIDDMRPLPEDVEGRVMQKLRLDWNYNSNAIEGNKLTYGETAAFLSEGITAKGKPLKDHLDIRGHNEAISFLLDIVKDPRPISEADIRALHRMILVEPYEVKAQTTSGAPTTKWITLGEYKTSPNHVKTSTGELHYYATPEETPAKMKELMDWYYEASNEKTVHPIVIAALFHHKFVEIHPFDDGNGRLSRILMNLIVMQKGFPPIVVKTDDRQNYYALLRRADVGEAWPFVEYIAESLRKSLQLYLKAAKGGDIDEDEDIDKEIALFKMELNNKVSLKEKKSIKAVEKIINEDLVPLFHKVVVKSNQFNDFFFSNLKFMHVEYETNGEEIKKENFLFTKDQIDLNQEIKNIKDLYFYRGYDEFKNEISFNIKIVWSVIFRDYNYIIIDEKKTQIISKFYHQSISKKNQQDIIRLFIDELKAKIKKNIGE